MYLLPFPDGIEDSLEWLGLEHHILHKVIGEVLDVNGANALGKFNLDVLNLILQGPHGSGMEKEM